jgi:ribosomal protein S18 acetylase RimI-like enzyme
MDEGWCRWVLERFDLPYVSLTDSVAKAGKLRDHFDVLLVPDMSLREMRDGNSAKDFPPQYAGGLGTAGIEAIREFVTNGGTLVLLDHASELATESLGVPVKRIVVPHRLTDVTRSRAPAVGESAEPLYAPGSILRVLVDTTDAISYGMPDTAAVYFTNSVTFDVGAASQVRVIARYPERGEDILLSGYLQGASQIAGKAAAVSAPVGRGHVVMFGFRPQHRGQSYGTFRMLFNALLAGGGTATRN